jgi:hypothetical protein
LRGTGCKRESIGDQPLSENQISARYHRLGTDLRALCYAASLGDTDEMEPGYFLKELVGEMALLLTK